MSSRSVRLSFRIPAVVYSAAMDEGPRRTAVKLGDIGKWIVLGKILGFDDDVKLINGGGLGADAGLVGLGLPQGLIKQHVIGGGQVDLLLLKRRWPPASAFLPTAASTSPAARRSAAARPALVLRSAAFAPLMPSALSGAPRFAAVAAT